MPEQHKDLLLLVFAVAAFVFVVFMLQARSMRRKLKAIAMSLGGEVVSGFLIGNYVRLRNYGAEARVELIPEGKNRPSYLFIHELVDLDFDLAITKESMVTRTMEKIGLPIEIKIGDPIFDEKYLVRSRSKDKAQNFLISAERRPIIDYIFTSGFQGVTIQRKMVSAQKPHYHDKDLEPTAIKGHLNQLRKFITG